MLYIRTDANSIIGMGHLMRCISIANAYSCIHGKEHVCFIKSDDYGESILNEYGLNRIILHNDYASKENELQLMVELLRKSDIEGSVLLIDSYEVTHKYLFELNKYIKTVYLDDIDAFEYPVSAIINYSIYAGELYREYRYAQKLLGLSYVPLQLKYEGISRRIVNEKINRILVLSGGVANEPFCVELMKKLIDGTQYQITVVTGVNTKLFNRLISKYGDNARVRVCDFVNNLDEYMMETDIAISAGGVTLYELCATGTPTLSFSYEDNQLRNVKKFDEDGLIKYCGDIRNYYDDGYSCQDGMRVVDTKLYGFENTINRIIENIMSMFSLEYRQDISVKLQNCVDGHGAMRIAEFLGTNM